MANSPLTLSRRHVLGKLYERCESVTNVPIYWKDVPESPIGYVESTGGYSDAFTFHLPDEVCKKLAAGQIHCTYDYEVLGAASKRLVRSKSNIRVRAFILESSTVKAIIRQP